MIEERVSPRKSRRHERLVGDAEDALHRAVGRRPEGVVELVDARLALHVAR